MNAAHDDYRQLREFLAEEMKLRGMGVREFAKHVNVSPATISRLLDVSRAYEPGLDVLRKISLNAGIPINVMLDKISNVNKQSPRTETDLIAYQLGRLNPDQRRLVLNLIKGFLASE